MKEHAASSFENEENLKDEISRIAPSLARLAIQLGISKLALNDKISKVLLDYLDEGFDKVTTQKRFIQSVTENESLIESEDLLYFEEDQSLHNTIIQLPLMERKVVVLSEFESLTNKEIEEWLSITSDEIVLLKQQAFEKIQSSSEVELNYNQWKDRFSLLQDAYKKLDLPYDVDSIVNRIVTIQSTSEVTSSMEKEKFSTSSQKIPIKRGVLISVFSLGILLGGLTGAILLPNSVSTAFSADLTKEEKKALNSLLSFYEERKEEVRSSLGVSSESLDQSTRKAELDFELFQAVKLAEEDPNNNENLFKDMEAKIIEGLATPQMILEDLKESDMEIDADAFVIKLEKALSATKEMVKAELKEKKLLVGSGENINYMIDEYLQGLIDKEHKHFELVAGMAQNNYYIYGTGESTPDIIFDAYKHSNSVDLYQYIPDGHMQYISYFLGWGSIEEDHIELDEYYDEYVRYTLINMETVLATLPKDSLLVEPTKAEYESLYRKFMELYTNEAFQDDGTIKSEKRQQMYYLKERYPYSTIGSTMSTAYYELQKQDFQKPDNWNTLMEIKTIKNDIPEQPIILYEGDLLPLSDELGRLYDQFVEGNYDKRTLVGLSLIDSFRLFLKANEENDLDAIFALSMESAYSQDNNYFIDHYKVIDVDEMVHHYNEVRALSYEPLGINGIEMFGEDRNISVNMEVHEDNWLVYPDPFYEDQNVE